MNIWKLDVDISKTSLETAAEDMKFWSFVRNVQFDHFISLREIPNDPSFPNQWGLNNTGQTGGTDDADIDAIEAWNLGTGGVTDAGIQIVCAVVDGGVQLDHNDLIDNIWRNEFEIPSNNIDDDNNGYIDDVFGWNSYVHSGNISLNSHGTHVNGIIGAMGNNGNLVSGVNWHVKLLNVAGESTVTSTVLESYGYILDQKMRWIETNGDSGAFIVAENSSFGIDEAFCEDGNYPLWNEMYNAMGEAGILSVAATANANYNVDVVGDVPTSCSSPFLISVTNTTKYDTKSNSAGYGLTTIDLGAPGTIILSTDLNHGSSNKSGTSMAAPHVAGAISLMHANANADFAAYYINEPAMASLELKNMILTTVDTLQSLVNTTVSGGRLNLYSACQTIAGWGYSDSTNIILHIKEKNIFLNGDSFVTHVFQTQNDTSSFSSRLFFPANSNIQVKIVNKTNLPQNWTFSHFSAPLIHIEPNDSAITGFFTPEPGVYSYYDTSFAGKATGLIGVVVVNNNLNDIPLVWAISEIDTTWLRAIENSANNPVSYQASQYYINGKNAPETYTESFSDFQVIASTNRHVAALNLGMLPHALRFHGFQVEYESYTKSIIGLYSQSQKEFLLPQLNTGEYPIHDQIMTSMRLWNNETDGLLFNLKVINP